MQIPAWNYRRTIDSADVNVNVRCGNGWLLIFLTSRPNPLFRSAPIKTINRNQYVESFGWGRLALKLFGGRPLKFPHRTENISNFDARTIFSLRVPERRLFDLNKRHILIATETKVVPRGTGDATGLCFNCVANYFT